MNRQIVAEDSLNSFSTKVQGLLADGWVPVPGTAGAAIGANQYQLARAFFIIMEKEF